jgi:opacity protein-like surface antigen
MNKINQWIVGLSSIYSIATVYAGAMGPITIEETQSSYLSIFGGGGSLSRISLAQLGTSFYTEAKGGPLAVNSFGQSNRTSEWLVGGTLGHRWENQTMPLISEWGIMSGAELEGFYLSSKNLTGYDINNSTSRLREHYFTLSYPTSAAVGLVNGIIYFKNPGYLKWHPYVGVGLGVASVYIKNATSEQIKPAEPFINHYNSDSSDSDTTFATQGKVGLSYDWLEHFSLFVEYRYLYLSATDFSFGSTVYPTHNVTSNWNVKFGSQSYNSGVGGIRFTI